MIKLSIIVPVFNVGELTIKCLESLINQSYKNIEIIIINDGSTDDSIKYITEYIKYPNVIYLENQENKGLGYSRNIGIANSTGEYITFVDSDDWVDLDLYNVMLDSATEQQADIIICGVKNEFTNYISSNERYTYFYNNYITKNKALSLLSRSESNNYMISPVVWNKLYKKDIITCNNINFINNSFWEDDIFTFQILTKANKISFVTNVYYHYFHREKSITNTFSKKHIDDLIYSFDYLKTYLIKNMYYDKYKRYFNSYFDRALSSMFQMLFKCEPSITQQKNYIIYLYEQFSSRFSVSDAIKYLDIERLKKLFI